MISLQPSTPFDYSILFHRLHECCGINGLALSWFKSYLSDRTQSVKVGSVLSHPMDLNSGVPQGSVLGPLLFSMYTNPLSSIIRSHRGIKHHFYADDTQLYITLSPSNFSQSMTALTDCLNDIQNFMAANKLKLNPDKTEFILIGSKYSRKQLHSLFPTDIYVHPPGGWIYYFCFFRRPMSDVRRPASDVRRHAWFPLI